MGVKNLGRDPWHTRELIVLEVFFVAENSSRKPLVPCGFNLVNFAVNRSRNHYYCCWFENLGALLTASPLGRAMTFVCHRVSHVLHAPSSLHRAMGHHVSVPHSLSLIRWLQLL